MVAPAQEGSPRADLERDIKDALRARENERLQTLRMLLADCKNKSIELGRDVDRDEFTALVRKGIKQRQEAAQQYERGKRPELRDKELREAARSSATCRRRSRRTTCDRPSASWWPSAVSPARARSAR